MITRWGSFPSSEVCDPYIESTTVLSDKGCLDIHIHVHPWVMGIIDLNGPISMWEPLPLARSYKNKLLATSFSNRTSDLNVHPTIYGWGKQSLNHSLPSFIFFVTRGMGKAAIVTYKCLPILTNGLNLTHLFSARWDVPWTSLIWDMQFTFLKFCFFHPFPKQC